jgi:DNA replication protein DnaC
MNETILQKMKQMKLNGMAAAFKTSLEDGRKVNLTADEMISFLIESEWDDRNNRRIERRIRTARFRYKANIKQIDFTIDHNLKKNLVNRFAECRLSKKIKISV